MFEQRSIKGERPQTNISNSPVYRRGAEQALHELESESFFQIQGAQPDAEYAASVDALLARAKGSAEKAISAHFPLNNLDYVLMDGLPQKQLSDPSERAFHCVHLSNPAMPCLFTVRILDTHGGPRARINGYITPGHERNEISALVSDLAKSLRTQVISRGQERDIYSDRDQTTFAVTGQFLRKLRIASLSLAGLVCASGTIQVLTTPKLPQWAAACYLLGVVGLVVGSTYLDALDRFVTKRGIEELKRRSALD